MTLPLTDLRHLILRRAASGILAVLWIIVPYSLVQHLAIRPIYWVAPSSFDLSIPVNFYGLWFYLSFYGLLGLIGLGTEDRVYRRYLTSIFWTAFLSHLVFLFIPNGVTREAIDLDSAPAVYQWLVLADQPRNAFPSLHASLSILAGLACLTSQKFNGLTRTLVWLWITGILWSTISLRQHYAFDLITGGGLAMIVWFLVGRYSFKGGRLRVGV